MPIGRGAYRTGEVRWRLRVEFLESRSLPSSAVGDGAVPPVDNSRAEPAQTGPTEKPVGDSSSTVDDDAASYVKADKSGAGGANSTGRPATNPSVTKPDDGTTPDSEGTKSVPAPLNYSKVSPVGYEHGEPVGTYDRIVFATPAFAVSTEATPRTNPGDLPTWPPIPTSPGSVPPSFIQGIPITHGILVETDSAPGPGQDPRGPEEPPPSGPVTRDELPVGGLIEPQAVRLPQVISIVFNPDGWASAAGDALRLLDEWATDVADPGSGWDRVYFWGAATAAVVLGIELTRRYRFTVRPDEWDDRTLLARMGRGRYARTEEK